MVISEFEMAEALISAKIAQSDEPMGAFDRTKNAFIEAIMSGCCSIDFAEAAHTCKTPEELEALSIAVRTRHMDKASSVSANGWL